MSPRKPALSNKQVVLIACLGVFILFCSLMFLFKYIFSNQPHPFRVNYNPIRICDDAFEKDEDHSADRNIRYFDVRLQEGCFGGIIHTPTQWNNWHAQPIGENQNDFWAGFWFVGDDRGRNPYRGNFDNIHSFNASYAAAFRLQGKGTIRFYANVASGRAEPQKKVKPTMEADEPDAPPPWIHRKDGDAVASSTPGLTQPHNIARVEPEYTDEARKVHFNDTVDVSVIIGEDGRVHDIKFPNPPGYGLEEQIIRALHQWKFRPGQKDGKAVAVHATIDITFKTN